MLISSFFRHLVSGLAAFQLAVVGPVAWGAGRCQKEISLSEQLKGWNLGANRLFRSQLKRLEVWNQVHISWRKSFNHTEFLSHRHQYLELLQALYPNGNSATNSLAAGSQIKISNKAKPEQKLAFLEAVGSHFITVSKNNPLKAENIFNTQLRNFLKKRRFFKKLNSLSLNKLKLYELESLLVDLYTLQNPGRNKLPAKVKALISSVLPFKGDFYQSWYRDAVIKRFFVATLSEGLIPAMEKMNMPVKNPLLSALRHHQVFRQALGTTISAALNWYVLIPMAYMFGYIHLPNVKLADWLPITKALKTEMESNPGLIKQIVSSGFKHQMMDQWVAKYGLSAKGARARFDITYRTLRAVYLGMALPPIVYFFVAQFGFFHVPALDQVMSYWDQLRWQLIPILLPETGEISAFEELVRPEEW